MNFTNLEAAPPLSIAMPAKINNGTAINTCLVNAPKDTCIRTDQGKLRPPIAAIELPNPKTKKIGTDIIKVTSEITKAETNIIYSLKKSFIFSIKSSIATKPKIKKPTGKAKNIHHIGTLISISSI